MESEEDLLKRWIEVTEWRRTKATVVEYRARQSVDLEFVLRLLS